MTRALSACAGAVVLALVLPAAAFAGHADVTNGQLQFIAGAAEANNVTMSQTGAAVTVTDSGAPLTPGPGCSAVGPNQVSCTAPSSGILVGLGDLNDSLQIDQSVASVPFGQFAGEDGADSITIAPRIVQSLVLGDGFNLPQPTDGADQINAGPGNSFIFGGGGNDTVNGGDGVDQIGGTGLGDGADTINGGGDVDFYGFLAGINLPIHISLDGVADDGVNCPGAGCEGDNIMGDVESAAGSNGNDVLIGNGGPNFLDGGQGNDTISGGAGADNVNGSGGDDTLSGDAGPDQVTGGDGVDRAAGGTGDDSFVSDQLADEPDTIAGGKGEDLMDYSDASAAVQVTLDGKANDGVAGENDNIGRDVEDVIGSSYGDLLAGSPAANDLQGGAGADRLTGGKGLDGLIGGDGADRLTGGPGHDLLEGDGGADGIRSRDHGGDEVECGAAVDRVKADRADRLTADCEKVRRR